MSNIGSVSSTIYKDILNFLKPAESKQSVVCDLKNLKLQDNSKVDEEVSVEDLIPQTKDLKDYYSSLVDSGVLECVGNNTPATLSSIIASAIGNGMSVQDACNVKNGISAYCKCEENQVAVSVEVDA